MVREESLLFIKIAGQIDGLHLSSRKLIMVYRSTFKLPQSKQIENKRNNLEFNHYILLWNILLRITYDIAHGILVFIEDETCYFMLSNVHTLEAH